MVRWPKNYKMANKGKFLEDAIEKSITKYNNMGEANIQKIPISVVILKEYKGKITSGYREKKSTLDFRGTVAPGLPISFDCKESEDSLGLPLAHITDHQIDYIKKALKVREFAFIIAYIKPLDHYYLAPGRIVTEKWDTWQQNKGKRGFNKILIKDMIELYSSRGIVIDFLPIVRDLASLDPKIIY